MKMKPCRNEIRQKRRGNSQDFMTPSDDIILLRRFSKFYYKYYEEGNTVPVENLSPFLSYVMKYLENEYTVGQISNRMLRLKEKYEVVKKNVENPEFCFNNEYESSLYEWGSVIWGERPIDNIPPLIDLVKTPEKNGKNKHGEEKVEKEEEKYNELLIYVCDSEEEKEREKKRLVDMEILPSYEEEKEREEKRLADMEILPSYEEEKEGEKKRLADMKILPSYEEEKEGEKKRLADMEILPSYEEEKVREKKRLADMEILPSYEEEKEKERGEIKFDDWVADSEEKEKEKEKEKDSEKSRNISIYYYELRKCLQNLKESYSWKLQ